MTIETLIRRVTKAEGKKKQISIAQVREVVGILADTVYELGRTKEHKDVDLMESLYNYGAVRAFKAAKAQNRKKSK